MFSVSDPDGGIKSWKKDFELTDNQTQLTTFQDIQ